VRSRVSRGTGNRQFHPGVLNHRPLHLLEIQVCYEINQELYCVNMDYDIPKIKSFNTIPLISSCLYCITYYFEIKAPSNLRRTPILKRDFRKNLDDNYDYVME
jgi:hypothetical protein